MARRHGTLLRSGQGMLLDETTLCATCWMHGVFAAQLTIGNTSLSQALLGLARPLQHHPLERAPHPDRRGRRLAAARGAVRLRDWPQRLPLDLPPRRADRHGASGRSGRRAGDAVAHRGRGPAMPVPGVRPPGPRRARARPCRPDRDRRGQQAVRVPPRPGIPVGPALPGCRLPSGHQHARCDRDDRRRRAAVRGRRAARRPLRGAADARDERAALRRRGLNDRSRSGRASRGEVRAWRRRCGDAGAGRTILGARHPRPADHRWRARRRGARYAVSVARAQRDGAPHRAARPGAVQGRRVGHARRMPGAGRVPAGARARRSRSRRSCASSSRSSTSLAATGRSGSCSSPMARSGTGTATAT